MNVSTMTAIREEFEQVAAGTPIPTFAATPAWSACCGRPGTQPLGSHWVDPAGHPGRLLPAQVSRLVGPVPPEPEAVVGALAESRGESIAVHGAEAARQLGLSTQTPAVTGLPHVGAKSHLQAGGAHYAAQACAAQGVGAGRYAGRNSTEGTQVSRTGPRDPSGHCSVRSALPAEEFKALREETGAMPAWLSDTFFHLNIQQKNSPSPV